MKSLAATSSASPNLSSSGDLCLKCLPLYSDRISFKVPAKSSLTEHCWQINILLAICFWTCLIRTLCFVPVLNGVTILYFHANENNNCYIFLVFELLPIHGRSHRYICMRRITACTFVCTRAFGALTINFPSFMHRNVLQQQPSVLVHQI